LNKKRIDVFGHSMVPYVYTLQFQLSSKSVGYVVHCNIIATRGGCRLRVRLK